MPASVYAFPVTRSEGSIPGLPPAPPPPRGSGWTCSSRSVRKTNSALTLDDLEDCGFRWRAEPLGETGPADKELVLGLRAVEPCLSSIEMPAEVEARLERSNTFDRPFLITAAVVQAYPHSTATGLPEGRFHVERRTLVLASSLMYALHAFRQAADPESTRSAAIEAHLSGMEPLIEARLRPNEGESWTRTFIVRPDYICEPDTLRRLGMERTTKGIRADLAVGFQPGGILVEQEDGARVQPQQTRPYKFPVAHVREPPYPLHFPWLFFAVKTELTKEQATYQAYFASMAGISLYWLIESWARAAASIEYVAFKEAHGAVWDVLHRSYAIAADGSTWRLYLMTLYLEGDQQRYRPTIVTHAYINSTKSLQRLLLILQRILGEAAIRQTLLEGLLDIVRRNINMSNFGFWWIFWYGEPLSRGRAGSTQSAPPHRPLRHGLRPRRYLGYRDIALPSTEGLGERATRQILLTWWQEEGLVRSKQAALDAISLPASLDHGYGIYRDRQRYATMATASSDTQSSGTSNGQPPKILRRRVSDHAARLRAHWPAI